MKISVDKFNEMGFISPASGNTWDFDYVLEKIASRSLIESDLSFNIIEMYSPQDFDDVDFRLNLEYKTSSQHCYESPNVTLRLNEFPIHITGTNSMITDRYAHLTKTPMSGELEIVTGNKTIVIEFKDLTQEQKLVVFKVISGKFKITMNQLFKEWLIGYANS